MPHTIPAPIETMIRQAGYGSGGVEALSRIEGSMFQFVRMIVQGEVPRRHLAELGLDLDLTHFHALTAVKRIGAGIGRDAATEATVGLLAEELAVDPSRASRLAADLIGRGYLVRGAAQQDGRKSILTLTEQAETALTAFREARWARMLAGLDGWSEAEIEAFSVLFTRYCDGMRRVYAEAPGAGEA